MKKLIGLSLAALSLSSYGFANTEPGIGETVIDELNQIGKISEIKGDYARVEWESAYIRPQAKLSTLAKKVACFEAICEGSRIANIYDSGTVSRVFADGKVEVDWDEDFLVKIASAAKLALKSSDCSGEFCVGAKIITEYGFKATILEVFGADLLRVEWKKGIQGDPIVSSKRFKLLE